MANLRLGEFIYERPLSADIEYSFKHALTHEVAYNSLLNERRRALHELIASAAESIYENAIDDHVFELAYHYQRSSNAAKAIHYLRLAGEQWLVRSQFNVAMECAIAALDRLHAISDDTMRARAELSLRLLQARAASGALGYTAVEVEDELARALQVSRQLGDRQTTFSATGVLCIYHLVRGEHRNAHALAEALLEHANREGDLGWLAQAQYARGANLCWMGRFHDAMRAHEDTLQYCETHAGAFNIAGADTLPFALSYRALCFWYLGYPEKALQIRAESLMRPRRVNQPYTEAASLLNLSQLGLLLAHPDTLSNIERLIALAEENGFQLFRIWGAGFRACVLLESQSDSEWAAFLANLIERARDMNARLATPFFLFCLAKAYCRTGRPAKALTVIDTTLAEIEQSLEQNWFAELHRVRGELRIMLDSNGAQGQIDIRDAIAIARLQGAKSIELRATMSFARLLDRDGRRDEARSMLAEIYNWFTEGFDTADLKDAKALLDELSR